MKPALFRLGLVSLLAQALVPIGCTHPALLPEPPPISDLGRAEGKAHRERGVELLVERGQVNEAVAEIKQALDLNPGDPQARLWALFASTLLLDENQAFEHALALAGTGAPEAELAVWEAYDLFGRRSQAERLAAVLQTLVDRPQNPPLLKDRARFFLGLTLRFLGRFDEAGRAFGALGNLHDWMVAGPFDNDQNTGFDTAYPPEQGFTSYQETYPGKLRPVGWRKVALFDYDDRINLGALLDPSRWSCAYLTTFIRSPAAREVAIRIAAYRGVKLWLNGRLLLSDDQAHLAALDQYVAGGRLEAGWNRLLCKICQRTGAWQLGLRLTKPEGGQLPDISFSTEIHPAPDRAKDATPLPKPLGFAQWLEKQSRETGDLPALLLAQWNQQNGFAERAAEQTSALSEAHPRCPLFLMLLARAHLVAEHIDSGLKAMREAARVAPNLPDAVVERVRYEQRHQRYDRALHLLAPLLASGYPPPLVREEAISLLADRGWNADALREAEKFRTDQPDRPSTWRTVAALQVALGQPERAGRTYERALELDPSHQGTYDRLIDLALDRGDSNEALKWVRRKNELFPALITSALREAEILLSREDYAGAAAVCDRLERTAPEYWYLHRLRGDILYRQGVRPAALASYRRALELHPDNPSLREYLDFLEQRPDPAFVRYALSEEAVEEVLTHPPNLAAHPEAEAVFLLDDQVTHVFQDGSSKNKVEQVYLIVNEKGQRSLSQFRVPSGASFRLEAAETIQPDGSRQEPTSISNGVIHFPALKPGSILHVAYRFDAPTPTWMEDHFAMNFNFQGPYPSLRARWVLVLPAGKTLSVKIVGDLVRQNSEALEGEKVYVWTAEHAPMLHAEALRPPANLITAAVHVSTVPSWEVLARWQNSLIEDQFDIDEPIRKKTRELVANAKTPFDKLRAISEFVARDIRYLNHDVGIFGKKPNKAINVFGNQFGDCKDKATLMIAMLKEVGIQAAYAAVRTRDRGPVFWEVPNAQTNHIVTYLPKQPGIDAPLFVDGTSRFGHFLSLPDQDQGLDALVLDGKGYQKIATPVLPPEASTVDTRIEATLGPKDLLQLSASEIWTGWFASVHRSGLNVEGKRTEELSKELNYRYPSARILSAQFHDLDSFAETAGADFTAEIPGRVRREEGTLRLNLLWPDNLSRSMAQEAKRHYDIFLGSRWTVVTRLTLKLPKGATVRTLPKPLSVDNDLLKFDLQCQAGEGEVRCTRLFQTKAREIPQGRYAEFRELCGQIDSTEAQDVVLSGVPETP